MLKTLGFYQFAAPGIKLSRLLALQEEAQSDIFAEFRNKNDLLVDIVAFCLLPASVNLILKQNKDNGIPFFLSQTLNSYTRFKNSRKDSKGPLFVDSYKAKKIDGSLLAASSRHMHLLPLTSRIVEDMSELEELPLCSYWEYLHPEYDSLTKKEYILDNFPGESGGYKAYVEDEAGYQGTLGEIKEFMFK